MPIEIRELIIRTEIDSSLAQTSRNTGASAPGEDHLQQLVDKVLEAIKNKQER